MTNRPTDVQAGARGEPSLMSAIAARMMSRLHRELGGRADACEHVASAVDRLWQAALDGHVCIGIDDPLEYRALRESPVVTRVEDSAASAAAKPLVLEGRQLYAERFWFAETRLAAALRAHARFDRIAAPARIAQALDESFGRCAPDAPDHQREAVACGLERGLLLLSGGPGTGKTTTIARLIAILAGLAPNTRIAIAAPTGKAAARAMQALAQELDRLGVSRTASGMPLAGQTLHRLLGARGPGGGFAHDARNPLPHDLIVVDEASMIDLELAHALLDAIRPQARLVLAGDRDQLASVEAGAVFAAACDAGPGEVRTSAVVLRRNFRQREAGAIIALAEAIRDGRVDRIPAAHEGQLAYFAQSVESPENLIAQLLDCVGQALAPGWRRMRDALAAADVDRYGDDARELLDAHARIGVLCALRSGPFGANRIGQAIAQQARRALGVTDSGAWFPGRLVIARRNSPELGVFNGEIGVCVVAGARLVVAFERGESLLYVPVLQMPDCADAYALTIHQAQGSEFDTVALVPAPAGHPLATRESLYTGVTRARRRLLVFGSAESLAWAGGNPTRRDGNLARRLGE